MTRGGDFTHVDATGKVRMVDVSAKSASVRRADAYCVVRTSVDLVSGAMSSTGVDVLVAAQLAGVAGAKETASLIPLCHPLTLDEIRVELTPRSGRVEITASVGATQRTGVEMEALCACAFAALSIVSAVLGEDPTVRVEELAVLRKSGGTSGEWGQLTSPPG